MLTHLAWASSAPLACQTSRRRRMLVQEDNMVAMLVWLPGDWRRGLDDWTTGGEDLRTGGEDWRRGLEDWRKGLEDWGRGLED